MTLLKFTAFKRKKRSVLVHILLFPYYLVKTLIFIILSPIVILVDLFRVNETLNKSWAVYLLTLSTVPIILSWFITKYNMEQTQMVFSTVSAYSRYSLSKKELKGVPFDDIINYHALQNDLDPALVAAIIQKESNFDPEAVSTAGARGLMQITPATWKYLMPHSSCDGNHLPPAVEHDCIFDPYANIEAGTKYLRMLLDDYNGNTVTVLAAYNAGSGNVARYGREQPFNIPAFPETQSYVKDVVDMWMDYRDKIPDLDLESSMILYEVNQKLYYISFALWFLLALWIIIKSDKRHMHNF